MHCKSWRTHPALQAELMSPNTDVALICVASSSQIAERRERGGRGVIWVRSAAFTSPKCPHSVAMVDFSKRALTKVDFTPCNSKSVSYSTWFSIVHRPDKGPVYLQKAFERLLPTPHCVSIPAQNRKLDGSPPLSGPLACTQNRKRLWPITYRPGWAWHRPANRETRWAGLPTDCLYG